MGLLWYMIKNIYHWIESSNRRLTPSYAAKDTIFWQKKTQNYRFQNYCRMTIFKSIHMAFYVNTSWASALFRNNKQHVVLGQKRKCLTIICCCQVQDYIYWITSTENDHRHHHKFIKYEKRLRKEGKNMFACTGQWIIN
jgi:hypothetical protein